MPHTIHTPVIRGKRQPQVSVLEAVGLTDPDPYTRAIFAQTAKENKQEANAPKADVGAVDAMRRKVLSMSLFPNIYNS